ncbi:hypothetical protein QBC37DRAFT_395278, partial [Rhypophila decipiens]
RELYNIFNYNLLLRVVEKLFQALKIIKRIAVTIHSGVISTDPINSRISAQRGFEVCCLGDHLRPPEKLPYVFSGRPITTRYTRDDNSSSHRDPNPWPTRSRQLHHPEWNRFCRKCTIDSQPRPRPTSSKQQDGDDSSPTEGTNSPVLPDHLLGPDYYLKLGTKFTFDVHMNPLNDDQASGGRATELEVSVLEPINEVVPTATAPLSISSSSSQSHHWRRRRRSSSIMSGASIPVSSEGGGGAASASERSSRKYTRRTGWRVAWKMRTNPFLPGWMLRSERVQEFVELDDEPKGCEYTCWETFYGVLAPVVRLSVGTQLTKGFNTWMVDLKRRAEEKVVEGALAPVYNNSE